MRIVHPQCTIWNEGSAARIDDNFEPEKAKPQIRSLQVLVVSNDMEASETDCREIFSCLLCSKAYIVRKRLQNQCTRVHMQETKQSEVERLETLKPENLHPPVLRAPGVHKL